MITNDASDSSESSARWDEIAPVLDDAIDELNPEDRAAVIHRFLKGCDFRQVATLLGVSEDAARMRVNRAIEKLQAALTNRGVILPVAALTSLLAAESIVAAPAGLESHVRNIATQSGAVAGASMLSVWINSLRSNWKASLAVGAFLAAVATLPFQPFASKTSSSSLGNVTPSTTASAASPDRTTPANSNSADAQIQNHSGHTRFRAVDAVTGAPLPGAKLRFNRFPRDQNITTLSLETDAEGIVLLPKPEFPVTANLFVSAGGHVPLVVSWRRGMPDEYTMRMPPGARVGGVIVDETGQPVRAATIDFNGRGNISELRENVQFGRDSRQVSDDRGHWISDMIPKEYDSISLVVSHADFANTVTNVPVGRSLSTNLVLVLKTGVEISGLVEDFNGRPIPGVAVKQIHNSAEPKRGAATDQLGRFTLQHVRSGDVLIGFQAPDQSLAPAAREVAVGNEPIALKVTLEPGHTLRVAVTDENEMPITNAMARTASDSQGERKVEWSTQTDVSGRFEWRGAPAEPLLYSFSAPGFYPAFSRSLKADGSLHRIKLNRRPAEESKPVTISGLVTDEQTGQPLNAFNVLMRSSQELDRSFDFAVEGRNGKFTLVVERSTTPSQLKIHALGYEPVISSNIVPSGDQQIQLKIRKGQGLYGQVLTSDATPVAGADVFLYDSNRSGVYLDKPPRAREGSATDARRFRTDEEGRFSFEPIGGGIGFITMHDLGYAEMPLNQFQSHIILQPWGRVEGMLMTGDRPVADERIAISVMQLRYYENGRTFPPLRLALETTTDSAGRFAFEKVPAGELQIRHWLKKPGKQIGRLYQGRELAITVKPGETTRADLGGSGAILIGRLTFDSSASIDWRTTPVELRLKIPTAIGDYPHRDAFTSNDAFVEARNRYAAVDRAFWSSPEGHEAIRARRGYWTFCNEDGSFTLRDIPAGSYEFQVDFRPPPPSPIAPTGALLEPPATATLMKQVNIGANEGTVDLGVLKLTPIQSAGN